MQGRSRSRSQTNQVPFMSPQQPPHTPARRTLASLNTPSPRASNVNLLKIKGSLTDPAPTRRRRTLGQVRPLLPFFFFSFVPNRIRRPTCSTSMRTVTTHIQPPSPTQNPWRFRYPLTTHLTILTYHLRIWTILTAPTFQGTMDRNPLHRSYAAQSAAT
jgi:hypothetical protein